jgi:hypothetical protein
MMLRRLLLFVTLLAPHALGEPVPGGDVRVERSEPAFDCPAEHDLVAAALALGTAPAATAGEGSSIVVRFDRNGVAYRALVRVSGQKTGERELRTDDGDCRRLADAVAVVVAVLLDIVPPEAAASFDVLPVPTTRAVTPPPPKVLPTPPPAAPPPPPVAPLATPPRRVAPKPPVEVGLRAEGGLSFGLVGGVFSPTVGGALAVTRGPWQAALGGFWVVPRKVPFDPLPTTSVLISMALGSADGCFRFAGGRPRPFEAWICGRFLAGVISGDGRGFDQHFPTHEPWFGAGPAFALRLPLTRAFALRFSAAGIVTLGDHTFTIRGYDTPAFDSPPVSASVALGPELTIW